MKLVYIASPYAGDVQSNTEAAKSYCRAALEEGVVPIAPHLLFPQFLEDNDPAERNLGLRAAHPQFLAAGEQLQSGPEAKVSLCRIAVLQKLRVQQMRGDGDGPFLQGGPAVSFRCFGIRLYIPRVGGRDID